MEEVSAVAAEQPPGVEGVDGRSGETLDHLEDVLALAAELPDEDEGDPVGEALDDNLYAELHQGCQRTARLTPSLMICWMSGLSMFYLISRQQSRRGLREPRA